jgi:hypothetical protein
MIDATSAEVTCAITTSASGPSSFRSCSVGRTMAAEPEARRTAYGDMAGPRELGDDQATQRRSDRSHARRQRARSEARRRRRSRTGTCIPTVSISMAKPASARNDSVALSGWTTSRPLRPRRTPATISPAARQCPHDPVGEMSCGGSSDSSCGCSTTSTTRRSRPRTSTPGSHGRGAAAYSRSSSSRARSASSAPAPTPRSTASPTLGLHLRLLTRSPSRMSAMGKRANCPLVHGCRVGVLP